MNELLIEIRKLLDLGWGDSNRLHQIIKTIEGNRELKISDRQYLLKIIQEKNKKRESSEGQITDYYWDDKFEDSGIDVIKKLEKKIREDREVS